MKRRRFIKNSSWAGAGAYFSPHVNPLIGNQSKSDIPVGIIGLDTSHSIAFTKIINQPQEEAGFDGFRVTHAYPHGSKEIESSVSRIPRYTKEINELGIEVVGSLTELLAKVEVVLLETNDGRLHLHQAEAVFQAGKRVFIDKPLAASLKDVVKIIALSEQYKVPFFSASALRFSPGTVEAANGEKIGKILGADTFSPATIEATHPDLFWYGIHGIEALFTLMGTGCTTVRRIFKEESDIVIGEWPDGLIGTFRGIRNGKSGYGGRAFGTKGITEAGAYEGYQHLVKEILQFFKTGIPPVSPAETLEMFTFMAAAEKSKHERGKAIEMASVLEKAK